MMQVFPTSLEDVNWQSKPKTVLIYVAIALTSVEIIFLSCIKFYLIFL